MELQFEQVIGQRGPIAEEQAYEHRDVGDGRDSAQLEEQLRDYVGVEYAVCLDSATTGMLLALRACGVEPGDTVLCTSFSYFATTQIIELVGAKPLFVDINPNTFSIDPYCLEYVIGKCGRTRKPMPRALIAVDLFGMPCNYDALTDICARNGIALIEDMAHAFGATFGGRKTGCFGRMAVASFFPSQPLGELGEGGAVFCHDSRDAQRLMALRRKILLDREQDIVRLGGSFLGSVQATVASEKLAVLDKELELRRKIAGWYRQRLDGKIKMQQSCKGGESAYTQFVIALKNTEERDKLLERLADQQIPTHIYQPSPIRHRAGGPDPDRLALVNAHSIAQRILSLPIDPYLSSRVVNFICDSILEVCEKPPEPVVPPAPEKSGGKGRRKKR